MQRDRGTGIGRAARTNAIDHGNAREIVIGNATGIVIGIEPNAKFIQS
jgi:hypothetical protein